MGVFTPITRAQVLTSLTATYAMRIGQLEHASDTILEDWMNEMNYTDGGYQIVE